MYSKYGTYHGVLEAAARNPLRPRTSTYVHPEVIENNMVGLLLEYKNQVNSSIDMDPQDQPDLLSKYGTTSALKVGSHETMIHFTGYHHNLSRHPGAQF